MLALGANMVFKFIVIFLFFSTYSGQINSPFYREKSGPLGGEEDEEKDYICSLENSSGMGNMFNYKRPKIIRQGARFEKSLLDLLIRGSDNFTTMEPYFWRLKSLSDNFYYMT